MAVPKALIFDFDGTILDTETYEIESWLDTFAAYGAHINRADLEAMVGRIDVPFDPYRLIINQGISVSSPGALRLEQRKRVYSRLEQASPLPGIVAMITSARDLGIKLGIASNSGSTWVEMHLHRLNLLHHFSGISCFVHNDTNPKPHPDIYKRALDQLGCASNEAVAFEDSPTGVKSARAADIFTVAIPYHAFSVDEFSSAQIVVRSLSDISLDEILARRRASK